MEPSARGDPQGQATGQADARILLIEDDEDDILLIARLIAQVPISVSITTVNNGREALDWLEKLSGADDPRAPNLVLLDINMPVMNGMHFLSILREHHAFRNIPVVALTTSTDLETVRRAYEFGANAVVNKVDSLEGMGEIVNTIVDFWFRVARRYFLD